MNQSDAERVRTVVEAMGYERTDSEEEASLLGIVSCSVRQRAIDRAYALIRRWNSWKNHRTLLTFATGCILPADRERFLKLFDFIFPIDELPQLPAMIRQYGVVTPASRDPATAIEEAPAPPAATASVAAGPLTLTDTSRYYWQIKPRYSSTVEAYVPIQNGCDKFCTFCAVPYTRGRELSRPSAEVLEEVSSLVERGYRSITLLGQNVNSYGLDRKGAEISFAALLRAIGELGKESGRRFWVYFTSPHPRDMTEEVIQTVAEYPCLAKQIHLPLQSGDDKVLIRMNRNYRVDEYRAVVQSIRALLPGATLFTDIIVGFTGETEEQFENTRKAMREFQYNMAFVAMYSPRRAPRATGGPTTFPMRRRSGGCTSCRKSCTQALWRGTAERWVAPCPCWSRVAIGNPAGSPEGRRTDPRPIPQHRRVPDRGDGGCDDHRNGASVDGGGAGCGSGVRPIGRYRSADRASAQPPWYAFRRPSMSSLIIFITASMTRLDRAEVLSPTSSGRIEGTICHETPNRSVSQPH